MNVRVNKWWMNEWASEWVNELLNKKKEKGIDSIYPFPAQFMKRVQKTRWDCVGWPYIKPFFSWIFTREGG